MRQPSTSGAVAALEIGRDGAGSEWGHQRCPRGPMRAAPRALQTPRRPPPGSPPLPTRRPATSARVAAPWQALGRRAGRPRRCPAHPTLTRGEARAAGGEQGPNVPWCRRPAQRRPDVRVGLFGRPWPPGKLANAARDMLGVCDHANAPAVSQERHIRGKEFPVLGCLAAWDRPGRGRASRAKVVFPGGARQATRRRRLSTL